MIFHNNSYNLRPTEGYLFLFDLENNFIKVQDSEDIYMPDGTAYQENYEGQGQIVKLSEFSRLGQIVDIGHESEWVKKEGITEGTLVYYVAQAATLLPISPSASIVRIPYSAVLGIVDPIPTHQGDVNVN